MHLLMRFDGPSSAHSITMPSVDEINPAVDQPVQQPSRPAQPDAYAEFGVMLIGHDWRGDRRSRRRLYCGTGEWSRFALR